MSVTTSTTANPLLRSTEELINLYSKLKLSSSLGRRKVRTVTLMLFQQEKHKDASHQFGAYKKMYPF